MNFFRQSFHLNSTRPTPRNPGRFTTLTTWDELHRDLELLRANGLAVDDEESEEGAQCVAVAIPGTFQVAISLSAPVTGLAGKGLAGVAHKLQAVSERIAQSLTGA